MPRRLAENYNQLRGKPHTGLRDPKKFGLTYEEVVRLIDEKRWAPFYKRWQRKQAQRAAIRELNYTCPVCNRELKDSSFWTLKGDKCKVCEQIETNKRRVEAGKLHANKGKTRGAGKKAAKSRYFCAICRTWQREVISLGTTIVCASCMNKA